MFHVFGGCFLINYSLDQNEKKLKIKFIQKKKKRGKKPTLISAIKKVNLVDKSLNLNMYSMINDNLKMFKKLKLINF